MRIQSLLRRTSRPRRAYLGVPGWNAGLVVLIVAAAVWGTLSSPNFLQMSQLMAGGQAAVVTSVLALGLMFTVLVGEIDISLTSNLAVVTVVIGLTSSLHWPSPAIVIVALFTGCVLGLINGLLVAYVAMPSLAVTLGTLSAYQGLAYLVGGATGYTSFPAPIAWIGAGFVGFVPFSLILFALAALVSSLLLHFTERGRSVYAVGRATPAVRHNGTSPAAVKAGAFVVGGFLAAVGGLMFVGFYGGASGSSANGSILLVVTAVALGGLDIYGGSGRVSSVFLAVVLIYLVQDVMGLLNLSTTIQTFVIGFLLIGSLAAVTLLNSEPVLRYFSRITDFRQRRKQTYSVPTDDRGEV